MSALRFSVFLIIHLLAVSLRGQTPPLSSELQQDLVEALFENYTLDDGGEIQPEWLTMLEDLLQQPLNLNAATREDLAVFFFLRTDQREAILQYRTQYGPFQDPLELQVVPGLEPSTVRRLVPFVRAGSDGLPPLQPSDWWRVGRKEITFRWERNIEPKRGYQVNDDGDPPAYEGDANRLLGRVRYTSGRMAYGVTFEKDPGEALFRGSNPNGFDFVSGHLAIRQPWRGCERIILGDYGLNIGQGLLLRTGFQAGKSAAISLIKNSNRQLFAQNTWQESRFFRGAAAQWKLGRQWSLMTFASWRNRDGNAILETIDTVLTDIPLRVSSFQLSGLHRTANEIADEGVFEERGGGMSLTYRNGDHKIGVNGVYFTYSPEFQPSPRPYRQFDFRGKELAAGSIDWQFRVARAQIFGEAAVSQNGGWGGLTGMLLSLDRRLQLALLARHFQRDYWTQWGAPFAESGLPRNESGLYVGMVLTPVYGWEIRAFVDVWQHPWLTFRSDSPTQGREVLLRTSYRKRHQWQAYLQYRRKQRYTDRANAGTDIPDQILDYRQQLRLQLEWEVYRVLTLRNRVEWTHAGGRTGEQNGYLAAQDVLIKPIGSRWSATMRYAIFRTDDYASRIYMFENDLLYTFAFRPYYHHGQRAYINLRYRPWPKLTLEGRYEVYHLENQDDIGTGLERIDGPMRSGVKFQMRWLL